MADCHVLPFVSERPSRRTGFDRTFWAPPCEGLGYFEACELGEELALEAVRFMRAKEFRFLLGWIAMDMPRRLNEAQKGTLIGFFSVFAELALRGASPGGGWQPTSWTSPGSASGCVSIWLRMKRRATSQTNKRAHGHGF